MKRRLVTHPRAERDVARNYTWIARHSPTGANAWYHAYRKAIERACEMPDHCAIAAETALVSLQVRQVLFKTQPGLKYRILFDIHGDELRVLRVRGPGQPPVRRRDLQ